VRALFVAYVLVITIGLALMVAAGVWHA